MTDTVTHIESGSGDAWNAVVVRKPNKRTKWYVVSATYTMECTFSIEAENEKEVRERLESISSESEILALDEPDRHVEIYAADLEVTEIEEAAHGKDGGL
jgi:hypothetical protein